MATTHGEQIKKGLQDDIDPRALPGPEQGSAVSRLDAIPWGESNLLVVFDYETSGLHRDDGAYPATLGLKWGPSQEEQLAIPVDQGALDKPGTTPTLFGDAPNVTPGEWADVHAWMLEQRLVAHNAKADLWFAWCGLRKDRQQRYDLSGAYFWDTMIVEALINPGERVAIEKVAERNGWNAPFEQTDQRMRTWAKTNQVDGQVRYDIAPWELLEPYLYGDLERTWLLYWSQYRQLGEGILPRPLVLRELDLVRCLFDMERRGLPYRRAESVQASTRAGNEIEEIERQLPFDPHSKNEVIVWLMRHGVTLGRTDTGAYSVDQPTIARAVDEGIPAAENYQRWAKLQTARNLWYLGWATKTGQDGRVRADYRQTKTYDGPRAAGTVSGRFAVSRVQVQAIPNRYQIPEGYPAMQDLIKPPDGSGVELWEADISQAEMRTVAVLSGCQPMLDGFREGLDAHDSTTRLIWNIEKDNPLWKKRRAVAKRLGFGVIYGAGIRTLAEQIRIFTGEDLGETGVRELWDQYRAAFPELFRYNRECQQQIKHRGYLVLPGGKVRKFQPYESEHKAMNAMIQGAVAVGMTAAMLEIDREAPGVMVGQVHDSVLFETGNPDDIHIVQSCISHTFERWFPGCPFPVEVTRYVDK